MGNLIERKITGSSNLPSDKLNTLSSSINNVLQLIVDVYNACENSNLLQADKFDKLKDARSMDKDIDQLIFCLGEEMNVCFEPVRNNMKPKFSEVSHNARELKVLINQYSAESASQLQTAKAIFERTLQLVNDAMDLLKIADQHFVERLVNEANHTLIYLKQIREAVNIQSHSLSLRKFEMTSPNMGDLIMAAQDFTTASVNLAKRLTKRIDSNVLPYDHQRNAVQALEVLKNESANVINVKRNQLSFPGTEMHAITLDATVKSIVAAVKVVFDIARADPNFTVDLQVDYVDDEFGLLLAKLVDAVDQCDNPVFVNLLGQIIRAVSNRSVDSGLPHDDPKIKKVKNDLIETRDISQQCLQLRELGVSSQVTISAGKSLDSTIKNLRHSYHALSHNQQADRTSLRSAARQIIANLDKLVVR